MTLRTARLPSVIRRHPGVVPALVMLLLGACSTERSLMPTPLLYQDMSPRIFSEAISPERKRAELSLLYITDRAPATAPQAELPYGQERSRAIAFGNTSVRMGENLEWQTLAWKSHSPEATKRIRLHLGTTTELGRFPDEPYDVVIDGPHIRRSPAAVAGHRQAKDALYRELAARLATSPSGEVLLYVHGFNETFESAAYTAAELCHFLGREDVCTFFTWPASASGNPLISYTATTESASFAVNHLKKTLRMIGEMPGVKGVHVLAHSRGGALTMDALSALGNEYQLRGTSFFSALPIRNVVLLSPDLDADIAAQRLGVGLSDPDLVPNWSVRRGSDGNGAPGFRLTTYASPKDRALLLSRLLFRSDRRVGRASAAEIPDEMQRFFEKWNRIELIIYEGKRTDAFGHAFFTSNPLVSSDLIQLIRFGKRPGDPQRPLRQVGPVTWVFETPGR
ncbi:MAG: alpha/beta hydrolase [Thiohalocapsa sp. PB-PSB1]|nr:MAG: alpha/beta hydrolase [Thiohalocapsa sp. PB-PSB1]